MPACSCSAATEVKVLSGANTFPLVSLHTHTLSWKTRTNVYAKRSALLYSSNVDLQGPPSKSSWSHINFFAILSAHNPLPSPGNSFHYAPSAYKHDSWRITNAVVVAKTWNLYGDHFWRSVISLFEICHGEWAEVPVENQKMVMQQPGCWSIWKKSEKMKSDRRGKRSRGGGGLNVWKEKKEKQFGWHRWDLIQPRFKSHFNSPFTHSLMERMEEGGSRWTSLEMPNKRRMVMRSEDSLRPVIDRKNVMIWRGLGTTLEGQ